MQQLQFPTKTHFGISPCKLACHITSPGAKPGSPTLDHIEACETKQRNGRFMLRTCQCLVFWPTHFVLTAFAVERTPSAPHDCDETSFEKHKHEDHKHKTPQHKHERNVSIYPSPLRTPTHYIVFWFSGGMG